MQKMEHLGTYCPIFINMKFYKWEYMNNLLAYVYKWKKGLINKVKLQGWCKCSCSRQFFFVGISLSLSISISLTLPEPWPPYWCSFRSTLYGGNSRVQSPATIFSLAPHTRVTISVDGMRLSIDISLGPTSASASGSAAAKARKNLLCSSFLCNALGQTVPQRILSGLLKTTLKNNRRLVCCS